MLSISINSVALSGSSLAPFPKLSPLISPLRQYTTFDAVSVSAAATKKDGAGKSRASHLKMQADAEPLTEYPTALLESMGGYDVETGGGIWDPLKLASVAKVEDLRWYRQAEIKHGRVAMFACLGYIAAKMGLVFSGDIARDGTQFADLVKDNPFAEWDAVPLAGKIQMISIAAIFELDAEQNTIDGGKVGEMPALRAALPWIPKGAPDSPKKAARREQGLLSELKNGRLAMVGIAGFYAAETIPGSVPFHF